jgi:hypothetical protein
VQGARHLLPGACGGDLRLCPAQKAGQIAGGGTAQGKKTTVLVSDNTRPPLSMAAPFATTAAT